MRTAEEKQKYREQRDKIDIQTVMATENGRRFLWRLLCYCGVYQDVVGESQDIMKSLGRRQVGLYLLGITSDVSEDLVFTMMKEAKNLTKQENYEDERDNDYDTDSEQPGHSTSIDDFIGDTDYELVPTGGPVL